MRFDTAPCVWYIQAQKEESPTKGNQLPRYGTGTWTYQSFLPENCGGSATQFLGTFPYIHECLTYNVLDLVDPWLEFTVFEYGHEVVCRCQGRGVRASTVGT